MGQAHVFGSLEGLEQALRYGVIQSVLHIVALAVVASGGLFVGQHMSESKKPLVHKLKEPLVLAGGEGGAVRTYLLPAGTSLYYDQAFPEGFVRYKVYVNVEGVDWEPKPTEEKFWIDPPSAIPVGRDQMANLIRNHPLTKGELRSILGGGSLSKDEIKALLREFSE